MSQVTPSPAVPAASKESPFFISGGTLPADALSYVERQADRDLIDCLRRGDYAYVLNTRQMGKSSLMVRTASRLRQDGYFVAILDLTAIGQNLSVEQWYDGMLLSLGSQLQMEDELEDFWLSKDNARLGPMQRWMEAIHQVVLPRIDSRLIIFVDEVDGVRSLPFEADEFFDGIRECFNRRTQDRTFEKVTFCLLGVATPADLIANARMSPFNIGRRIIVTDFTAAEAASLADRLPGGQPTLMRVLHWTGGHPYMTQRLCRAIVESPESSVDEIVDRLFLSRAARDSDDNLAFVRNRLLKSEVDIASLLELYEKVRAGARVRDDEMNPRVPVLRLSGVVRVDNGFLKVRNRIYDRVFDSEWVMAHMPDAELRRQRAAFRRGVIRSAAVFSGITFIIALLAGLSYSSAVRARAASELAKAEAERATRLLYVSNINRTQQLYDANNVGRALGILKEIASDPKQAPLRGFEWAYLYGLCHPERKLLHGFRSWSLSFSRTGELASLGREGVQIWAAPYDKLPVVLTAPNPEHCNSGAFSPDGRNYAMCDSDGGIYVWDVRTRLIVRQVKIAPGVQCVAYSPDGKLIGSACSDGMTRLWDAATLRPVGSWNVDGKGNLYTIAFSPDSSTVATGGADGICRVWDVRTGALKWTLSGHSWYIYTIAFSPDGETLATAGGDRLVLIWDWKTGKQRYTLQGHGSFIYGMGFSPDGRTLATSSWDNTVRMWDTKKGMLNRVVRGHTSHVYTTAFAVDGKTLASGGNDGTVRIWDAGPTEEGVTLFKQARAISWPQFSPDETAMIYSSLVGFRIYSFKTGSASDLFANAGEIGAAEFAGSSNRVIGSLLVPGPNRREEWECKALLEWDVARKQITRRLDIQLHNFGISSDGKLLAGSSPGGDIEIWDAERLKRIQSILWTGGSMVRFTFSPDNRLVVGTGTGLEPCAWEVATGRQLYTLAGHMGSVHRIAFSPDGRYILTAGHEPSAYLWDSSNGHQVAAFSGHSQIVNGVAFSSDGKRILTASADFTVKIWDVASARELVTFTGHSRDVGSAIFRSGGREIASTGMDGLLLAWRAPTAEQVAAWQAEDSHVE